MLSWVAYLRRPLAVALLLALVYQAGACPCGCWDESIWQQMLGDASCWLRRTGAAGDVHCAHEPVGPPANPSIRGAIDRSRSAIRAATDEHSSQCEEQARIASRDSQQPPRDLRAGLSDWCGLAATPPALELSTHLKLRSAGNWHPAETRADVRAFLQVFLL